MKTFKVTLEFDNQSAAENFFANWLDGGGDGGGNIDWNTTKWTFKSMRIRGTGYAIVDGVVMTPEAEEADFNRRSDKIRNAK